MVGKILREQKGMKLKGNLYHFTQVSMAYNSNRIEGSELTEDETRYIYDTNTIGLTDRAVKVDDIIETANHFKMFDYMLEHYEDKLNSDMLKQFHYLLKRSTSDESHSWFKVGDYKLLENEVGGMETSSPEAVAENIERLIKEYNSKDDTSIEDIIEFHVRFERIHPFQDGNGRVGRIIMFKECLKNNIMPFIIDDKHKLYYYRGLKEFDSQRGYLIDTCLSAQDHYEMVVDKFTKSHEQKINKSKPKSR